MEAVHSIAIVHTSSHLLCNENGIYKVCVQSIAQLHNSCGNLVELHRLLAAIALNDIHRHLESANFLKAADLEHSETCGWT